jgi:hypothetical protein
MKKLITFAAIFLLLGNAFPQEVSWFEGTFDEAKVKAKESEKHILIEFTGLGV